MKPMTEEESFNASEMYRNMYVFAAWVRQAHAYLSGLRKFGKAPEIKVLTSQGVETIAVSCPPTLLITGDRGTGKTCFMRAIGEILCQSNGIPEPLISMGIDLVEEVPHQIQRQGFCLLDGLDSVPNHLIAHLILQRLVLSPNDPLRSYSIDAPLVVGLRACSPPPFSMTTLNVHLPLPIAGAHSEQSEDVIANCIRFITPFLHASA